MPKSLLNELSVYDNLKYPLTLKIKNTIMGIYEICEDIDSIYIPDYICEKIDLIEPCMIDIEILNTEFPKATFLKLKPYSSNFYDIQDTKGFLENGLKKNYTHIEENTIIELIYDNKLLKFDIIETQPKGLISLNETNVEVDFEEAHDYKPPPPPPPPQVATSEPTSGAFNPGKFKFTRNTNEVPCPETKEFIPFSGAGRKLGN
jgi:ubiquitin fusion degradation protein 1